MPGHCCFFWSKSPTETLQTESSTCNITQQNLLLHMYDERVLNLQFDATTNWEVFVSSKRESTPSVCDIAIDRSPSSEPKLNY